MLFKGAVSGTTIRLGSWYPTFVKKAKHANYKRCVFVQAMASSMKCLCCGMDLIL